MRATTHRLDVAAECRCGHSAQRHYGPTYAGPCDMNCGCLAFHGA